MNCPCSEQALEIYQAGVYLSDSDAFSVSHGYHFIKCKDEIEGIGRDALLVHWVHILWQDLGQQSECFQIL